MMMMMIMSSWESAFRYHYQVATMRSQFCVGVEMMYLIHLFFLFSLDFRKYHVNNWIQGSLGRQIMPRNPATQRDATLFSHVSCKFNNPIGAEGAEGAVEAEA